MNAKDQRISFFTILFSEFINYAGIAIVYPLFAFMLFDPTLHFLPPETSSSVRGLWLGILIALHPFLQFLCAPIFGSLSDLKGRKHLLQLTMFLGFIGYLLACLACMVQSLILLAAFRVFVGIAAGSCSIVSAIVADLSTPENKTKNYGLLNMAFGAGFTLGPFISGALAYHIHLSAPFFVACLIVAINWFLISWKLKETRANAVQKRVCSLHLSSRYLGIASFVQLKLAANKKELRFLFLVLFIFSFGWAFFTEFAALFLIDRFDFKPNTIGFFYAYNGFFYAFSAGFLIYPLIRWLKIDNILFLSMLFSGLFLALFAYIRSSYLLWACLPILQFFLSFVYPAICTSISNRVSSNHQGEAMGMYQGIISLAIAITPMCGGSFVGSCPVLVIFLSAIFMLAAALINFFLKDQIPIFDAD